MTQMTVSPDSPLTPGGGTVRTLVWDDENRLLKTTDKSGTNENITSYSYDASGMRALKKGKYGTVQYVSDNYTVRNKDLISKHVFAGNTRLVSKTVMQEEKSGKMVATEQGAYYYHHDHLGSSSVITDKAGKFYEQLEYMAFGETWIQNKATNEQTSTPYRYTGKIQDEETGLYYYGARYYDSKLSRWCSVDPPLARGDYLPTGNEERDANLPGMGGVFNTINLDAYHYAGDNPVKYIDTDGNVLKIYIWKYEGSKAGQRWGHASMELGNGEYISWWPNTREVTDVSRINPHIYTANAYENRTYKQDVIAEGQMPDYVIIIDGLDEKAIMDWWIEYKKDRDWSSLSRNCSTTIAKALEAGGGDKYSDFLDLFNTVWTPEAVRDYANSIKEGLQKAGKMADDQMYKPPYYITPPNDGLRYERPLVPVEGN